MNVEIINDCCFCIGFGISLGMCVGILVQMLMYGITKALSLVNIN